MFRNNLYLLHYNLLIIATIIMSLHINAFPQETKQNSQDERNFATIEIISEPENAQVFINQKYKGVTPCTVDSLRSGTHLIELKLDNYKPFSEKITVKEGAYKKLVIELSKITGNLVIISSPENACLEMNEDTIGNTPFTIENVKLGAYSLSLSKKNFKTYKTTVSANEGKTDTVAIKLEPLFSITKIFSTPDKADVIINGANFGKTPFQCETLHPGPYEIIISKDGYLPKKTKTEIKNESTNIINVKLISKEIAESQKHEKWSRFQNFRRIFFGSLTVGFCVPSIIFSVKTAKARENEEDAWDDYMQPNLGSDEYDNLYEIYEGKVSETNEIINVRNAFFKATGITLIGFVISIPF